MTAFKTPVFAKLVLKLSRAHNELEHVKAHLSTKRGEILGGSWSDVSALAQGVHNVYNGIEDVILSIAKDVDGTVPTGKNVLQDIIDQLGAPLGDIRSAVYDSNLHARLTELKGFRHLVRHRYGFDYIPSKVIENAEAMIDVFPAFTGAVADLDRLLTPAPEEVEDKESHPKGP